MMKMLMTYTSTLRFLLKLLEMLNNNYSSAKTKFLGLMLILILGKLIYTTLYTTFSGDPSTVSRQLTLETQDIQQINNKRYEQMKYWHIAAKTQRWI